MAWQIEEVWAIAGAIKVDESYYGGRRKGNRGLGTEGKVPVFGILQQGGKISTQVISAATSQTLLSIIWEKVVPDSIVYTHSYRSDNALDISELKHSRMNHSKLFADKHHHIIWHPKLLESGKTPLASNITGFPNNSSPCSGKKVNGGFTMVLPSK